ncbi:hypothetical protein DFQ26_001910 [Actinomortierella ambigua]|nr:hypothetical protein DFQ26_001910 [Actinomortierella ambigua]
MLHFRSIFSLAFVLLFGITGLSLPHQVVLRPLSNVRSYASGVISGDDARGLLQSLAGELDRGMPQGWQALVQQPQTTGTTAIETVDPTNLNQVMDSWGIDVSIRDEAYQNVRTLIDLHAQESTFVSQRFNYNVPGCRGGALPVCLQTLMVVTRRLAEDSEEVEIWHVYIESFSNAVQQYNWQHYCHSCRLISRCCHDNQIPRDLSFEETQVIQAVLSTSQASWATDHLPTEVAISSSPQGPPLPDLLRRFFNNAAENTDVFKKYDDVLLATLQGSMQAAQQQTRSFSLTIKERDLPMLENLLSPCLKKASVHDSVQKMWKQAQRGSFDKPFSLECQNIQQARLIDDQPAPGCNKSSTFTVHTQHSWVLLSPRHDAIDCVFIGGSVDARHSECEIYPSFPGGDDVHLSSPHCLGGKSPSLPPEGSIVRLSIPQEDGRFTHVRFAAEWSNYSQQDNKAIMDIIRYADAAAFLRIPVARPLALESSSDFHLTSLDLNSTELGASMLALGTGLGAIGEGWSKFANAIGPHSSETVKRHICLGFQKYEHVVRALAAQGVPKDRFVEVVDALIEIAKPQVPDVEDLRKAMIVLEYSDDVTWTGNAVSYTSSDGYTRFFYFYKHLDAATDKINIVFGNLKADFTLAPDVLSIEKKKVGWFGFKHEESVELRNLPHDVTPGDAALLNKYFEVVAYRMLRLALNMTLPEYPSMNAVCDHP